MLHLAVVLELVFAASSKPTTAAPPILVGSANLRVPIERGQEMRAQACRAKHYPKQFPEITQTNTAYFDRSSLVSLVASAQLGVPTEYGQEIRAQDHQEDYPSQFQRPLRRTQFTSISRRCSKEHSGRHSMKYFCGRCLPQRRASTDWLKNLDEHLDNDIDRARQGTRLLREASVFPHAENLGLVCFPVALVDANSSRLHLISSGGGCGC